MNQVELFEGGAAHIHCVGAARGQVNVLMPTPVAPESATERDIAVSQRLVRHRGRHEVRIVLHHEVLVQVVKRDHRNG